MKTRFAGLFIATLAGVAPAGAQTWRTVEVSRQLHDTASVSAHVDYAAGHLDLKSVAGTALYHASVRYDAERAEPVASFDRATRALALGVHLRGMRLGNMDDQHDMGSMQVELSERVPLDLSMELGAVEADLQFGGLRLTDLSLRSGAADVTARFDKPNRERMNSMTLQVGAAQVKLLDVANSGVSRINAEVGAGSLTIDLAGALSRDVDVTATLAVGGLTLNVSSDDGVFVDENTVLGGFKKDGFTKRADGWYSANFDTAARKVRVHLHAFLGGLTLTRQQN